MKKLLFVFNPNSGKGQIRNYMVDIIKTFSDGGYEITVYPTKAPRDAYEYIRANEGLYDVIACSGGDGTLNETVAAVMEYGVKPPVGYIPSGTTNDFARSLKIPRSMEEAAKNIVNGYPEKIDVATFNGRYYNYVAAFGAFTEVSYATPQQFKNILGHQAYMIEGVKSLKTIKPFHIEVQSSEVSFEGDCIYGMITNTTSVGGFKNLTGKDVKLNDGLFECTFIKVPVGILDVNELWNSIVNKEGNVLKNAGLINFRAGNLKVHSDVPLAWVLDGEFGGNVSDVDIEVKKQAVEIIVPERIV